LEGFFFRGRLDPASPANQAVERVRVYVSLNLAGKIIEFLRLSARPIAL
jgi:hypothetical protein